MDSASEVAAVVTNGSTFLHVYRYEVRVLVCRSKSRVADVIRTELAVSRTQRDFRR
jgi:hypothetical protein